MKNYNQLLLEFDYQQNFQEDDFYVGKSNKHIFEMINQWPNWEKNILNISGQKFSGKTHLINIFLKKNKGIKFDMHQFNNECLQKIKSFQNIILENLNNKVDEKLLYTLFNIVDQDSKFLIITSLQPIVDIKFNLNDLKSRTKNCLLLNIEKPDDELMFALILKNLSDRQILIDKKLIDYVIKRIDRSYDKISDFIYKIDRISLKKKKSIDFKIIKEALGD